MATDTWPHQRLLPKPNGYQSLHTTILGPGQKFIEFQIRTRDMHNQAENGIAANWAYAESKGTKSYVKRRASTATKNETSWIEKLRAWQKEFTDPKEFLDSLKIDFLEDRIFIMTPRGEVIDLPSGSTPVDFAYQIHSDIGDGCIGAKVNGKLVSLNHQLKSQDVVEIVYQKNRKPSEDWLDFVVTSTARHYIKRSLKSKRNLMAKNKRSAELKITIKDKIGILREISSLITRSQINMISINSNAQDGGKFKTLIVKCDTANKDKVWKLILRLKKIKEVKAVDYRFVS